MNLYTLFERCLTIKYINVEGHISYNWEREDSTLYIYFQHSQGAQDWASNFNFPHRAYKAGGEEHFAHRGYLEAWECVLPYLEPKILDKSLSSIIVVGYSHGAGIGTLCHEYIWHKRSDIRKSCYGFGFGSPRVMWGKECTLCNEIWKNYLVIKNIDDIVTDLPPSWLGFWHVGTTLEIGKAGKYSRIDAHKPENILRELGELT